MIFHRHDMPSPWMNYLTNGTFFTMISQAGGSLSWYKSPEIWRIGRYNFYNLPTDGNGLFIYIKDKKTGKVWNPTVIPCDERLDKWHSAHGFGYTRFHAEKDGVTVDLNCFVGTENVLIYDMNISADDAREISVFACREISFYATGTIRGVGMRDAAQDVLANVLYDLPASKEKILLLLGQQYNCGKTNHYFYPVEKREPLVSDRSDNHLCLVYAVYKVICESGKTDFLYKTAPYYDGGEGTVLEHIEKSIEYTVNHLGEHSLPLMLGSDWNDMLSNVCKEGKGESVFVSQMLVLAYKQLKEIYEIIGKNGGRLDEIVERQEKVLNDYCWNEDRFIRAVSDEGLKIGNRDERCGSLWINSQSWAVMSECSDEKRLRKCMETTVSTLDCGYGLLKLYPPLQRNYPSKEHELTFAQPGVNENGGVFCHANTWAIISECLLGNNNEAYKIYKELIPHNIVKKFGVERYNAEPYVYSSNIRAPMALDAGQAGVSWLSGTASWMMIALEEYIFGVKPCYKGLKIKPCIPDEWEKATVKRRFRGCEYAITIDNSERCGNSVKEIFVNGEKFDGEYILSVAPTAEILIVMGKA